MKTHHYPKMFKEAMEGVTNSKLSDILKVLQDSLRIDDDNKHR